MHCRTGETRVRNHMTEILAVEELEGGERRQVISFCAVKFAESPFMQM